MGKGGEKGPAPFASLAGKVAIVTGGGQGIGAGIAQVFAAAEAKVLVATRTAEHGERTVDGIRRAGGEARAFACNVSREDELRALVDATLAAWGRIDTLIANAAANPHYGPFLDIPDDMFDKTVLVNLRNVMKLCRMAIPAMAAGGGGAIVVTSSVAALHGSDRLGTYALTKAAGAQPARNLAVAHGHQGITANAVLPGLVKTHFARALWESPQALAAAERATALGRIGEPADLAGIAVYLASPAGRWTTGQGFVVDGGWAACGAGWGDDGGQGRG